MPGQSRPSQTLVEKYHRNVAIYHAYLRGQIVAMVAAEYHLTERSVYRIIAMMSKERMSSFS